MFLYATSEGVIPSPFVIHQLIIDPIEMIYGSNILQRFPAANVIKKIPVTKSIPAPTDALYMLWGVQFIYAFSTYTKIRVVEKIAAMSIDAEEVQIGLSSPVLHLQLASLV